MRSCRNQDIPDPMPHKVEPEPRHTNLLLLREIVGTLYYHPVQTLLRYLKGSKRMPCESDYTMQNPEKSFRRTNLINQIRDFPRQFPRLNVFEFFDLGHKS